MGARLEDCQILGDARRPDFCIGSDWKGMPLWKTAQSVYRMLAAPFFSPNSMVHGRSSWICGASPWWKGFQASIRMKSSTIACENGLASQTQLKTKINSPTCMLLEPTSSDIPLISAILVARDGWRDLDKLLEHLRKQTIQSKLELLIVADSLEKIAVPESKLRCARLNSRR